MKELQFLQHFILIRLKLIMNKKILILDYGLGNIMSLKNAIIKIGFNPQLYSQTKRIDDFEILIIPGVGSFNKASNIFKKKNLFKIITKFYLSNKKIIGICLGMQLMLSKGYEFKKSSGINLIKGNVKKVNNKIKLPIVGWYKTTFNKKKFEYFNNKKFYYIHSFAANDVIKKNILCRNKCQKLNYISGIIDKNLYGFQFHPEKSGNIGLKLLKNTILD